VSAVISEIDGLVPPASLAESGGPAAQHMKSAPTRKKRGAGTLLRRSSCGGGGGGGGSGGEESVFAVLGDRQAALRRAAESCRGELPPHHGPYDS